jgi:hypothetical protein
MTPSWFLAVATLLRAAVAQSQVQNVSYGGYLIGGCRDGHPLDHATALSASLYRRFLTPVGRGHNREGPYHETTRSEARSWTFHTDRLMEAVPAGRASRRDVGRGAEQLFNSDGTGQVTVIDRQGQAPSIRKSELIL